MGDTLEITRKEDTTMIDATMTTAIQTQQNDLPRPADSAFQPAARLDFPPRLTFYHPSPKGTGSAVAFEIDPATSDKDGSIYMAIAVQNGTSAPATDGQPRRHASFDWRNRVMVKLSFAEVSELMIVLCGMAPSNSKNGRNGFYHDTATATTTIDFRRGDDPARPGFFLGVTRTPKNGAENKQNLGFVFSLGEALGLRLAIEHSMGLLAFGIPRCRQRQSPGIVRNDDQPMAI